jgi:DNA polymerase-3 subunit gamma/tau
VDVLEIDGASNRGIDSIRELRETVRYRPSKSRYKVYIIDEVHMLTTEAFNALLKTLEEPPEHVIFIFATTEPHKIPSTILSRCQRFDFRRIDTSRLLDHLKTIIDQEEVRLSESVLYSIAREADGSMRDAQSLLEQLLAFSGDGLSDEEVLDVLGVVDRRSVQRTGGAILEGDTGTCLQIVEDLYRRGIDSRRFCQQLCDFFRSLLWLTIGRDREDLSLELPETEKQFLLNLARGTSAESLHLYLQTLLKGEEDVRRSSLPRLSLEMLLFRLSQLPRLETLDRVATQLERIEEALAGLPERPAHEPSLAKTLDGRREESPEEFVPITPTEGNPLPEEADVPSARRPEPGPSPDQGEPAPLLTSDQLISRWSTFVSWLQGRTPKLAAKLNQSTPRLISETAAELEILEVYENLFHDRETIAALADSVASYFGRRLEWSISTRSSLQSDRYGDHRKSASAKSSPRRLVMECTAVQQAIEILGGEIIEVRTLEKRHRAGVKGLAPGSKE